jgi:transposase
MSFNMKTTKIFVGVDVSKATLVVYHPDKNQVVQIDNSDEAIGGLCSELEKKKRQIRVVMEGTGGYEYLLVKHLACHKIEAAVINPRRIRDFSKGIGMDAKTDPIDAQVISKYAEVVVPKPIATKSDHELKHGALVARRNQLLELSTTSAVHVDHRCHASQSGHSSVLRSPKIAGQRIQSRNRRLHA